MIKTIFHIEAFNFINILKEVQWNTANNNNIAVFNPINKRLSPGRKIFFIINYTYFVFNLLIESKFKKMKTNQELLFARDMESHEILEDILSFD